MNPVFAREAVLFANDAYYRAFADCDPAAMDALWARSAPVTCIHPGWHALKTREHIMEAWRRIFAADQAPIACRAPEVFVTGEMAFVICYELLSDVLLVATNIFRREGDQWLMVHHQSGPVPAPSQLPATDATSPTLN